MLTSLIWSDFNSIRWFDPIGKRSGEAIQTIRPAKLECFVATRLAVTADDPPLASLSP